MIEEERTKCSCDETGLCDYCLNQHILEKYANTTAENAKKVYEFIEQVEV